MFKRFWWVFLIGLIVGPFVGVIVGGVIAYVTPKQFESTAVLQIRPQTMLRMLPANVASTDAGVLIATELEVIRSQVVLEAVVDQMDLTNRWMMSRSEAIQQLRTAIRTNQIKGTDLIEVRVLTTNRGDARLIAEAVSAAYRTHRIETERDRNDQALEELREAIREQEDIVEEKRKVLTQLIRNGAYPPEQNNQTTAQKFADLQSEVIKLESQIETMLGYDGDELYSYAASIDLPENIVKPLHLRRLEARRQLAAARAAGMGDSHPNVRRQLKIFEGLTQDLDEGVATLRETLRTQLELVKEQAERIRIQAAEEQEESIEPDSSAETFDKAKSEFETTQSLLEKLKIKLIGEEMGKRITEDPVIVHAAPIEPQAPSSPNVILHLLIGAAGGLLLGLVAPLLLVPFLRAGSQ